MANKEFEVKHGLIVNTNLLIVTGGQVMVNTTSSNITFLISANDAIGIPGGNTGQRAGGDGAFRYNSELKIFEGKANNTWAQMSGNTYGYATTSQILSNVANLIIDPPAYWSMGAYIDLTDAATIALGMSNGVNFSVTLGGNRTLGWPTNIKIGQEGKIKVLQDGTGNRTLSFFANSTFKYTFDNSVAPQVDPAASHITLLSYAVIQANLIFISVPGYGIQ